jgi:hypothetical protein
VGGKARLQQGELPFCNHFIIVSDAAIVGHNTVWPCRETFGAINLANRIDGALYCDQRAKQSIRANLWLYNLIST